MSADATTVGSITGTGSGKSNLATISLIIGIVGLVLAGLGMAMGVSGHDVRPTIGVLIMFCFYLSIGIGMLMLVILHHLFGSGWSTVHRRQLEHGISVFPWLFLIFLPFLVITQIDNGFIWHWLDSHARDTDILLQKKEWWLSPGFFYGRVALFFGIWIVVSHFLRKWSFAQDADGDPKWSRRMAKLAAAGVVLTALSLTGAAIDWIKSIEAHWFSTMYGVWFFAASMRAALAVITLLCLYGVYKNGPLTGLFKRGHLYDLGCLMLAFTIFWAYISFSQYFLIYNANIPEETFWYVMREAGNWKFVGFALIFFHFFFPFLFLLFYGNKVKPLPMIFISVWILSFHLLDLYFNILPSIRMGDRGLYAPVSFSIHWVDVVAFFGIGGIFLWSYLRSRAKAKIIPIKDPRILESLNHHGR